MEIVDLPITLRDLSDNFRNPLAGILLTVELLREDSILTNEQRSYLNRHYIVDIQICIERLKNLADKLLEARKVQ